MGGVLPLVEVLPLVKSIFGREKEGKKLKMKMFAFFQCSRQLQQLATFLIASFGAHFMFNLEIKMYTYISATIYCVCIKKFFFF